MSHSDAPRHFTRVRRQSSGSHSPPETVTDAELLRRAGRDPDAFAVFYRRHAGAVLTFFWNRTACAETAADLAAETFAQAYLSRRRYRPGPAPATAWLFAIARHQFSHYVRSASVASRGRARLGMRVGAHSSEELDRVEELADFANHRDTIHQALTRLSTALGDAVRFRVIDELSYDDVAERLGCTPAAARQRVARGLDQLATELEVLR
jgi:RNA polymerase sigma factor (sigma-70 family)